LTVHFDCMVRKKVAVFGSRFQSEKLCLIHGLFDVFKQYDTEVYICKSFYEFLSTVTTELPTVSGVIEGHDFMVDYAVSIGGDGTYLRTAHRVGDKRIPIIGINTGRLGFLADLECADMESFVGKIYKHEYKIQELSLLNLKINNRLFERYPAALNEIAILKGDGSSMITIHVTVDGDYLNAYQADGLLIATPTGSTADSLSVGGPIVMPDSDSLIIAAVSPHNLAVRPIIVRNNSVIELKVESRTQNFLVSLDGNSFMLPCSASLQITLAGYTIKAVRKEDFSFFQTLRKKLFWGIDPRQDTF
jgi:NAD+ kinase